MMSSKRLMIVMGVLLAVAILTSSALAAKTYEWNGNAKYATWWRYGNWSGPSGNRPGVDNTSNTNNDDIAKLKWMGATSGRKAQPRLERGYALGKIMFLNTKNHNITINDDQNWNGSNGNNRRTFRLNGQSGDALVAQDDADGTYTYSFDPGVRILQDRNLDWHVSGDERVNVNGRVSGSGKIEKYGTGTLSFQNTGKQMTNNGTNPLDVLGGKVILGKKNNNTTINGNILINHSTAILQLNQNHQINDNRTVTLQNGLFNLNGKSETLGKLVLDSGTVSGGASTLTCTGANDFDLRSGTVSAKLAGAASLLKTTGGTVTLSGASTYTGATDVAAGTLLVNGSIATSSLTTVQSGATLGGSGAVGLLDLYGEVSPGTSPGTIAAGNTTWYGGGSFLFEINDVDAGAGSDPGWDLLDITGTLDIDATILDPFEVDITSVLLDGSAGDVHDFDASD